MNTITLTEVKAAQDAFLTTQWPPMPAQWSALKDAAVDAVKAYAKQERTDVQTVLEALK